MSDIELGDLVKSTTSVSGRNYYGVVLLVSENTVYCPVLWPGSLQEAIDKAKDYLRLIPNPTKKEVGKTLTWRPNLTLVAKCVIDLETNKQGPTKVDECICPMVSGGGINHNESCSYILMKYGR